MANICVFCGSRTGRGSGYGALASRLGRALAESGHTLVYGGGHVGMMGLLADAALEAGGEVIGVIPENLVNVEAGHGGLTRLEVVTDMLTRKQRMIDLSDAFLTLPGGLGTLDELFEVLTWRQLGLHCKPMLLIDENDYYRPLLDWMKQADGEGFLRGGDLTALILCRSVEDALSALNTPNQG
ncbi:LOG family protein [Natronospira bacteriovora]|uniref:Cytokinin riboside 5'-monophosphate phosphoribohydrolase n=1 Tax=Natronospira bacteriovora TaxID=3069753 RepID=A0ABU0W5S0_9GAMM|nr:TIGR00730 family Rossman fold protein [Natronospira sp. AB-CW4]MDQ2069346.1 TIGR00730 family Rossman fold protein [Natronospira sp. AB-CW4]